MGIKEKIVNIFKSETTEKMPKIDPGFEKITKRTEVNRFENSDEKLVTTPEDQKETATSSPESPESTEPADQDIIASD